MRKSENTGERNEQGLGDRGRQEGVAGGHDGGGRKKDEGDEEREAEGRRPASRTKTQVHIQGDVGRWPGVTSIKDGLPLTAAAAAPGRTVSSLDAPCYARLDDHLVTLPLADFSIRLAREDRTNRGRNLVVASW